MTYEIKNVSEAITWVKETVFNNWGFASPQDQQPSIHIWYRGHKSDGYTLTPSTFRDAHKSQIYEEGGMLNHLMRRLP